MNLGYACINSTLGSQKPKVTTNRSMIKRTFEAKGVDYASELTLNNVKDLPGLSELKAAGFLDNVNTSRLNLLDDDEPDEEQPDLPINDGEIISEDQAIV